MTRQIVVPAQEGPSKQRGAIAIMSAFLLSALLAFFVVTIDTGRLFYEKRQTQKLADLAALETALLYCRDQTLTESERRAIALEVLAPERNNFPGGDEDITVELGRVETQTAEDGSKSKTFVVDENGFGVRVTLNKVVTASIFALVRPGIPSTINLKPAGVAQACQPTASLSIRSSMASVDLSRSSLLNDQLGGLLGNPLSVSVAGWNGLVSGTVNMRDLLDNLADTLGLPSGEYETAMTTSIPVDELLEAIADVAGEAGFADAATALDDIAAAVPGGVTDLTLRDLVVVQIGAPNTAFDTNLQAMQLVQGIIQNVAAASGTSPEIDENLLGLANVSIRTKILEPPILANTGNPAHAAEDPNGNDAIYVRTAQLRTFAAIDLPISGAALSALEGLITNPLLGTLSSALSTLSGASPPSSADDLCPLGITSPCTTESDVLDVKFIENPRLDILVQGGAGDARVTNHSCNSSGTERELNTSVRSSAAQVMAGEFGSTTDDAADNAFGDDEPDPAILPLIDIGSVRVRKTCVLLVACTTEYRRADGSWTTDAAQAERTAYSGGGIGARMTGNYLAGQGSLDYSNSSGDEYLPEISDVLSDDAYQSVYSNSISDGVEDSLLGLELVFYDPTTESTLATVSDAMGAAASTLTSTMNATINATLEPVVNALFDQIHESLGVSLAEVEVGGSMTCQSDKVELVM